MPKQINDLESELSTLARTARLHVRAVDATVGVDPAAQSILGLLTEEGSQRIGQIAQTLRLDPSTVTRQIQVVLSEGLAHRTPDPQDRRASIIDLTEKGREHGRRASDARRDLLDRVVGQWPVEDQQSLARLLAKYNAATEASTQSLDGANPD